MRNKMRVGIFTHDFFPVKWGQWTHIKNIYDCFFQLWFHDFMIFSPEKNDLKNHQIIFPEENSSKLKNISYSFKLYKNICKIIKKYALTHIHFHGWPGGVFFWKKMNIPVIYTAHHTYWQQYKYVPWQKWKKIFFFFEKWSYQNADKIICVSQDTLNIIRDKYWILEKKLIYIPNGINLADFEIDSNIQKQEKSLVFVGRLDERKGIDFLVRSMVKIIEFDSEIKLFIVGDGKFRDKLEKFTRENNLEKNIFFLGRLSWNALKKQIQQSEIMIIPSVFEWFGISVLEWIALKIPVIWTDVDGIRTIIHNWENGILIPYNDKDSLTQKVIELIQNKELQETLVKNAYNNLEKKFNWTDITKKTIYGYTKLSE